MNDDDETRSNTSAATVTAIARVGEATEEESHMLQQVSTVIAELAPNQRLNIADIATTIRDLRLLSQDDVKILFELTGPIRSVEDEALSHYLVQSEQASRVFRQIIEARGIATILNLTPIAGPSYQRINSPSADLLPFTEEEMAALTPEKNNNDSPATVVNNLHRNAVQQIDEFIPRYRQAQEMLRRINFSRDDNFEAVRGTINEELASLKLSLQELQPSPKGKRKEVSNEDLRSYATARLKLQLAEAEETAENLKHAIEALRANRNRLTQEAVEQLVTDSSKWESHTKQFMAITAEIEEQQTQLHLAKSHLTEINRQHGLQTHLKKEVDKKPGLKSVLRGGTVTRPKVKRLLQLSEKLDPTKYEKFVKNVLDHLDLNRHQVLRVPEYDPDKAGAVWLGPGKKYGADCDLVTREEHGKWKIYSVDKDTSADINACNEGKTKIALGVLDKNEQRLRLLQSRRQFVTSEYEEMGNILQEILEHKVALEAALANFNQKAKSNSLLTKQAQLELYESHSEHGDDDTLAHIEERVDKLIVGFQIKLRNELVKICTSIELGELNFSTDREKNRVLKSLRKQMAEIRDLTRLAADDRYSLCLSIEKLLEIERKTDVMGLSMQLEVNKAINNYFAGHDEATGTQTNITRTRINPHETRQIAGNPFYEFPNFTLFHTVDANQVNHEVLIVPNEVLRRHNIVVTIGQPIAFHIGRPQSPGGGYGR